MRGCVAMVLFRELEYFLVNGCILPAGGSHAYSLGYVLVISWDNPVNTKNEFRFFQSCFTPAGCYRHSYWGAMGANHIYDEFCSVDTCDDLRVSTC